MGVFTWIGVIVTGVFIFKRRHWFMDRNAFFSKVRSLRTWQKDLNSNRLLDDIIEIVTGGNKVTEKEEQTLEQDVARVIKRIKKAKEEEKITAKAKTMIEQIKESLED